MWLRIGRLLSIVKIPFLQRLQRHLTGKFMYSKGIIQWHKVYFKVGIFFGKLSRKKQWARLQKCVRKCIKNRTKIKIFSKSQRIFFSPQNNGFVYNKTADFYLFVALNPLSFFFVSCHIFIGPHTEKKVYKEFFSDLGLCVTHQVKVMKFLSMGQ